ncbi:MAG: NTP transferase domain-containing protein, partial [Sulfuricella sp.]|nr:NTP transferase domain-containing protein [Sulfuricella sp.]
MISKLNIVILAAGKGTRMHSDLPKVLHPLAGRPLLGHVIDVARRLTPAKLLVVYGHGGEALPKAFPDRDIVWVNQAQQLGTGHAMQQAVPELDQDGVTLVLYGDVPLIAAETLRTLLNAAQGESVGLLTVDLPDPAGYGRIVRDVQGQVKAIVEHKDASE